MSKLMDDVPEDEKLDDVLARANSKARSPIPASETKSGGKPQGTADIRQMMVDKDDQIKKQRRMIRDLQKRLAVSTKKTNRMLLQKGMLVTFFPARRFIEPKKKVEVVATRKPSTSQNKLSAEQKITVNRVISAWQSADSDDIPISKEAMEKDVNWERKKRRLRLNAAGQWLVLERTIPGTTQQVVEWTCRPQDLVGVLYGVRSYNFKELKKCELGFRERYKPWECFSVVSHNNVLDFALKSDQMTEFILAIQSLIKFPYHDWTYGAMLGQRGWMKLNQAAKNVGMNPVKYFAYCLKKAFVGKEQEALRKHRSVINTFQLPKEKVQNHVSVLRSSKKKD
jgi:hypothetical protein